MMYASRTGTERNLNLLRANGWRLLVSATGVWRHEGFPYAIDNGAWTSHQQETEFDGDKYRGLVAATGSDADWIVLPDVVGDAVKTAAMTDEWLPQLEGHRLLAVIQDGAETAVLEGLLPFVRGFFLGGSTDYKLSSMQRWGEWCKARGAYFHVGRVNSARRIRRCVAAGADSCDGTSGSKYAVSIAPLTQAKDAAVYRQKCQQRLF